MEPMRVRRVIDWVQRHGALMWSAIALAVLASVWALRTAPLDAIPDIADPQIAIYAKWQRSPQLVESEVTGPLIKGLLGTPGIQSIRGTTHMGYAFVYAIVASGASREAVRQRVVDRLNGLRGQLPADATV